MIQKTSSYLLALFLLSGGVVFAQTHNEAALPNPGITPESRFYFLDKLGEAMREFFTFSPEGRARLQIAFAAERIAEIKIILETKGVEAKGLAVAQSRLQAHLARAAGIIADEKAEGTDVSQLAKELDDEFDDLKNALKATFRAEKNALKIQEDELKAKIREARQTGDTAQVDALVKRLGDVKAQKELLEQEEEEQEEALEREEGRIEEEMEAKEEAEKAIRDAGEEKLEILDEAAEEGMALVFPAETFEKFDRLLAQAKELFVQGNYQGAKQLARQAKNGLETIEDAIEELEEAQDKEEELKEEQEEKEREAKEEKEELKKEEAKQAARRLEKEAEQARKEAKKAEERLREIGDEDEDEDEDDR